jgi:chromosome segregation ATPase
MLKALSQIQEDKENVVSGKLENSLNKIKSENQLLQTKLETFSQINCEQQINIKNLLNQIEEKNSLIEKLQTKKFDETKRLKQQTQLHQDKLKYQQHKYENEIDELKKKHIKEFEQVKLSSEQSVSRNGELSRTNLDLRKKLQTAEEQIRELNEKLAIQKQQHDLQLKQKKELKEDFDRKESHLKKDLNALESMRDEYLRKNEVQQKSIEKMIEQINTFQNEINSLIKHNKSLNESLKKYKLSYEGYKKKYCDLKTFIQQNEQQQSFNFNLASSLNEFNPSNSSGIYLNDIKKLQDELAYLTPPSSNGSAKTRSLSTFSPKHDENIINENRTGWYDMKLHMVDNSKLN